MRRLLAFALVAATAAPLAAQRPRFVTGVEYYALSFDPGAGTKSLNELVVPIGVSFPISRRFSLEAGTYYVNAQRTAETDTTTSISGLTDVLVRAAWQLKPDFATLTFSLNLPTGVTELDTAQLEVASRVASDLVPFPVTSFGAGFSATTGLAIAVPAGSWAVGLGGSYRYNGDYTPLLDSAGTKLTPGSEFRLRIGADRLVGQSRLTLGLTYSTFSQDEFGASRASPGARIITQASYGLAMGNSSLSFYAWDIHRLAGDSVGGLPGRKQNTLALGVIGAFRLAGNVLRPSIEVRQEWAGDSALASSGKLFGFGARYSMNLSPRLTIVPGARLDVGSVPLGGSSLGFTGVSGSLSVRIGL